MVAGPGLRWARARYVRCRAAGRAGFRKSLRRTAVERAHGLRWYMGMPYNIAIANACDEKHALTLSRPVDSPSGLPISVWHPLVRKTLVACVHTPLTSQRGMASGNRVLQRLPKGRLVRNRSVIED
jgi:hypothetical protein